MDDLTQISSNKTNVILYDAHCNFCAAVVRFILKRDKEKIFRFGAIQSPQSRALLRTHGINFASLKTIFFVSENTVLTKSEAVFAIIRLLPGAVKSLLIFRFLPLSVTNAGYTLIAKYRYKIFGKSDIEIPFPEDEKSRLIS